MWLFIVDLWSQGSHYSVFDPRFHDSKVLRDKINQDRCWKGKERKVCTSIAWNELLKQMQPHPEYHSQQNTLYSWAEDCHSPWQADHSSGVSRKLFYNNVDYDNGMSYELFPMHNPSCSSATVCPQCQTCVSAQLESTPYHTWLSLIRHSTTTLHVYSLKAMFTKAQSLPAVQTIVSLRY